MIGWASAPYDPDWERRYPRRAAWMALAGPTANFSLLLIAAIAIRVGVGLGYFRPPAVATFTHVTESTAAGGAGLAATFLSILFVLNLVLGAFNLIPVPPLDGHSVVMLLLPKRTALRYLDWFRTGGFGWIGLLAAWLLFDKVFDFLYPLALTLLYPGTRYH